MSNSLPGNPYAEALATMLRDGALSHESLSILALAHEKRTENLIALAALCTANGHKELGQPFIDLVMERIGIDGDDA